MKFSIIIPCYNEAENIPSLLDAFSFLKNRKDAEMIIVDNGSNDKTAETLSKLLPDYPFARLEKVEKNEGYGYGISRGLKAAKGEYVGWTHGDLQFDPRDIEKALNIVEAEGNEKIFVKGKRRRRNWADNLFTAGMALFESFFMGVFLWDINGQPTFFHRSFMKNWSNPPKDFTLDLYAYAMAKKRGFSIKRFEVFLREREKGMSSWNKSFSDRFKLAAKVLVSSRKMKEEVLADFDKLGDKK